MENNFNSIKGNNPIVVAMSGGVDSSVAAALMNKDYEDVIGVTLRLYDEKKKWQTRKHVVRVQILWMQKK